MADLDSRFDRLKLDQAQDGHHQQSSSTLGVPGQGVRKQRSQRFTVPTALSSHSYPAPSPVPPLPYQPPPLPVQAQSANLFHLADQHNPHQQQQRQHGLPRSFFPASLDPHSHSNSHSLDPYAQFASYPAPPVPPTLAPEFLASPTGMSPYPGPAFRPPQSSFAGAYGGVGGGAGQGFLGVQQQQQYQAPGMQQQLSGGSAGGGSRFNHGQVPHVVEDLDEDIIDTAIVIKNIPFACPKDQLLNIMSSLALPPPFAFNYHFAPEDPTSFRGLAFANYRDGHEAGVVRAAMDGLEIMGRKLRCEFKKQLKPGEKEAIERTKALKRMRSAQLLAGGGGGGAPDFGWNRREASAPGGYAGGGMVTGAAGGGAGGGSGAGWNAGLGVSAGEDGVEDYGRPLAFGEGAHLGGAPSPMDSAPSPSSTISRGGPTTSFGQREFVPAGAPPPPSQQQQFQHQRQHSYQSQHQHQHQHVGHERQHSAHAGGATHMSPSYSSESASASPPSSDVGTSVSQRMERGPGSVDSEVDTVATTASVGTAAGGKNDLDLNDPPTLELYSRVLLFQGDSLRDELAFSRSLSPQQRRTVHLIAKKLGLEHRSLGDGESRHVVVYKPGTAPPPDARRPLRGSVSIAALRRVASRDAFHSPSSSRHNTSYLPPPLPTSYLLPSHTGGSSNGSLATSVAGLRGKKSLPNLSVNGHLQHYSHQGGLRGHSSSSEEDSRSSSPVPAVPPMPTSISLSAHLAAYASGGGYASAASPLSSSPVGAESGGSGSGGAAGVNNAASAAFTRRSYSNLRSMAASPARDPASSSQQQYATIGHSSFAAVGSPSSSSAAPRRREIPSVQGLFQARGIADKDAAAAAGPSSPERERTNSYGAAQGTATAARQPSGPGSEVHDWRRRA